MGRRRRSPARSRSPWWPRLGLGGLGLATLVVIALLAFNGGTAPANSTDPSAFSLPALTGPGQVRLSALRGQPVVVNFFASWCTQCRAELPVFAADAQALRGQAHFLEVDSLETGDGSAMARELHLARSGAILARDVGGAQSSGLHDALGGGSYMPVTAFYGRRGQLLFTHVGAFTSATLAAQIHRLYGLTV